jgi:hypothetical protein
MKFHHKVMLLYILRTPRIQPLQILPERMLNFVHPLSSLIPYPLLPKHVLVRPDVLSNCSSRLLQMSGERSIHMFFTISGDKAVLHIICVHQTEVFERRDHEAMRNDYVTPSVSLRP